MKVCSALGTPSSTKWPEGHKLASQLGYKFPLMKKTPLEDLIPEASAEALDLIERMFEYDPNNRITARECLQHEYFKDFTPIKFSKCKGMKINMSAMNNKNNKLLNSKFIRMSSKKLDPERKKSPFTSKTNEIVKPNFAKHRGNQKINKFSVMSKEYGGFTGKSKENSGGFYIKNKPIKSPGTSNSSNNSKGFLINQNYGHK